MRLNSPVLLKMHLSLSKLTVIAGFIALTSCLTVKRQSNAIDYSKALAAVRGSLQKRGIPRAKIIEHFQLYEAKSERIQGGIRGGHMSTLESWNLPHGHRLTAIERTYVGRDLQFTWLQKDHPLLTTASPMIMTQEFYAELPIKPYFDALYLFDHRGRLIESIDLHFKTKAEPCVATGDRVHG